MKRIVWVLVLVLVGFIVLGCFWWVRLDLKGEDAFSPNEARLSRNWYLREKKVRYLGLVKRTDSSYIRVLILNNANQIEVRNIFISGTLGNTAISQVPMFDVTNQGKQISDFNFNKLIIGKKLSIAFLKLDGVKNLVQLEPYCQKMPRLCDLAGYIDVSEEEYLVTGITAKII